MRFLKVILTIKMGNLTIFTLFRSILWELSAEAPVLGINWRRDSAARRSCLLADSPWSSLQRLPRRRSRKGAHDGPAESLVIPGLGILDRLQVGGHVGAGQGPGHLGAQGMEVDVLRHREISM